MNRDRAGNGLGPVVADATLSGVADSAPYSGCGFPVAGRAADMGQRNYFNHAIPGCSNQSVFNILDTSGIVYSGAGENIAWMKGTTDPVVAAESLHSQWMNSSAHRANVLNPLYNAIGIGSWHTAPGQTWSSGGYTLGNVYVGVEVFGNVLSPTPVLVGPPPGRLTPLTPTRVLDTRDGISAPVGTGGTIDVQLTGQGGVPASGTAAVALNLTVTGPSNAGWLTAYPTGQAQPLASNLNFPAGATVAVRAMVKLGAGGKVTLAVAGGAANVIVDVGGWFSDASAAGTLGALVPLTPARILDTRDGTAGIPGPLAPSSTVEVPIAGRGGVPLIGARAVVLNVTVTQPAASGFLTIFPAGGAPPVASDLNFVAGDNRPTLVVVQLGAGGKVGLFTQASTHVIFDVAGWIS